jgi:hypothetical protein
MGQRNAYGRQAASAPRRRVLAPLWRTLAKSLLDPYRPERHYMRGPGPKWHAKHDYAASAGRTPA